MDILRRGIDEYDDDPSAAAPGIEAPPMIGQDERRMHVRAYNFWAKLLEGRSFPAIDSLDLDELGDFGPNSLLLDFTSGIDNPAISFIGTALASECELDDEVHYIADVPRRSLLSRLTDHYLQIIANRAPIGFEAEFVNARGATILYRGVLLPFSSDDDTIDFILGVINWKQAAEPELAASLADELVEEMAAEIAAPLRRPTVPVWADGPEAEIDDVETDEDGEDGEDGMAAIDADDIPADRFASFEDETYELTADAMLTVPDKFALAINDVGEPIVRALVANDDAFADNDDGIEPLPSDDDEDASLADRLAQARMSADAAAQANARGHAALYQAIGRAFAFAVAAEDAPEDYAELLDEAGIAGSPRSPMTPVAKLVFGAQHDKTRIAEYAAVLGHAATAAIAPADLPAYLSRYTGGLKGLLREVRSAGKAGAPAADAATAVAERLRRAAPIAMLTLPEDGNDDEFVVLVARRMPDGSHAVIARIDGETAAATRTLKAAAKQAAAAGKRRG